MKIKLHIKYSTRPGEQIYVTGNIPELGNGDKSKALLMNYFNLTEWFVEFKTKKKSFEYSYFVKNEIDNSIRDEWAPHSFEKHILSKEIIVRDYWNIAILPQYNLGTHLFNEVAPRFDAKKLRVLKKNTHRFKIHFPLFNQHQVMLVVGSTPELGSWNPEKGLQMKPAGNNFWYIDAEIPHLNQPFEYKYVIYDLKLKQIVFFEEGENRVGFPVSEEEVQVYNDVSFNTPAIDRWRLSGTAVPVFSLRTGNSCGVGEFNDLKLLGKWAKKAGFSMIQILPINDTTANFSWEDCYPYAAISVYALHPMYMNLRDLPYPLTKKELSSLEKKTKELNQSNGVEYELVNAFKRDFTQSYFQRNWKKIARDKKFLNYIEENKDWLIAYAVFSSLRDEYGTSDFKKWKKHQEPSEKLLGAINDETHLLYANVNYYCFLQWVLDLQLKNAVKELHKNGVALKGDLPIGIYRNSADAWSQRELFHMDQQAGAPPDDFAVLGQNWEFPTYNWEKMKEDNYEWWKSRFEFMSRYFDAFRIDHILGFFRIWQIPSEQVQGILGRFEPSIALSFQELKNRGIYLEYDRLVQPWITNEIIDQLFGEHSSEAKDKFFECVENKPIKLKEKYNTQRKVKAELGIESPFYEPLLSIIANVLFIAEDNQAENLHPRYALQDTSSYHWLDDHHKFVLNEIYYDYFYHRQEEFWKQKGLEKLPMLKKATNMLTCGEDLGMVPRVVPEVMQDLAILNLQIQRMPSNPHVAFSHPADAPYLCVVSPASHDTSTLRQWWKEDRDKISYFYHQFMGHYGEPPHELTPELQEEILHQHLYSPAMLCVIPIQEFLGIDKDLRNPDEDAERINIPSVFPHKWDYRMHLSIEELLKHKDFTQKLKQLHQRSGRIK